MNKFRFKKNLLQFIIPLLALFFILPGELISKGSTRIVITKNDQSTLEGVLISVETAEKYLVVQTDNTGVKIPLDEIDSLWLQRETPGRRNIGTHVLVGALLGAGVGYVIYRRPSDYPRRYLVRLCAAFFGVLGLIDGLSKRSPKGIVTKWRS